MRINALKAHSLRGIPRSWPDLPVGKRGLVIYGPNGVGKSSIVDGFEFALTRRSTLFPENRLGVSWDAAAPHVRDGSAQIVISLLDGSTQIEIGPAISSSELTPTARAWVERAGESNFVLRRHMLLRFINERPQDRYTLLAPFCNLDQFQPIETALRTWAEKLETDRAAHSGSVIASEQRFRQTFKIAPHGAVTEAALLENMNAALREVGLSPCSTPADCNGKLAELTGALGDQQQTQRLAALGGLKNQAQRIGRISDLSESMGTLLAALRELEQAHAGPAQDVLIDLLAEGKRVIEAAGLTTCPLCEQAIDRDTVLTRINERILADKRITETRSKVAERRNILIRPLADHRETLRQFVDSWASQKLDSLPQDYQTDGRLLNDLVAALDDTSLTSSRWEGLIARAQASISTHTDVIARLNALISKEGGGERRNKLLDTLNMIKSFVAEWVAHSTLVEKLHSLQEQKHGALHCAVS
jgi:hypothetical protein